MHVTVFVLIQEFLGIGPREWQRKEDRLKGWLFIWGEENMIKIYLKLNIVLNNNKYNKKNPPKRKIPFPREINPEF